VGRPDDVPCLLTQPGNIVMAQAAGLQGASRDDTHLAAVDGAPPRRPDPAGAMDGNRQDRHLAGDRDDEGAVFEGADRAIR
jgi:hypothetical protein